MENTKTIIKCASCNSEKIHQKASVWIDLLDPGRVINIDDHWFEREYFCLKCKEKVNVNITQEKV